MEIKIKGMHCDACEKTIKRTLEKEGAQVRSISYKKGRAEVETDLPPERIDALLQKKGYSLDTGAQRKARTGIERQILINGAITLIMLLAVQIVLSLFIYQRMPGYSSKYLLPLIYVPIAVVTNIVALWHQRAYHATVSCMSGMMIGMTIGMTTGFTIGGIVGLTNGMFTGSLVGMLIGIGAGVYAGKCCGIMGMMEGMMAGLMGGTMGAMLTVMMIYDHVAIFLPILIGATIVILAGLMRMVVEEHGNTEATPWPLWAVLGASLLTTTLISIIMMLAPKGLY